MPIGEVILGAFLGVLFDRMASAEMIKLAQYEGIRSQLKKWTIISSQIQDVLADAGARQMIETPVRAWLHELHNLAYDISDLLDDLATEAAQRRQASTNKVSKVIPKFIRSAPHKYTYGCKMSSKIKGITNKLTNLTEWISKLNLIKDGERSNRSNNRFVETSLFIKSDIVGRERDTQILQHKLRSEECNKNVCVVSIVGMGGIGKTTLAQLLYKDDDVISHFKLRVWVSVSSKFDVRHISEVIYQRLNERHEYFSDLNLLHEVLEEQLLDIRFLLVLDDVWDEDEKKWEQLQRLFVKAAFGSRIIVTTQKAKVVSMVNNDHLHPHPPYNPEVLPNSEALLLLVKNAYGVQNFGSHPILHPHDQVIMKKCGGSPFALTRLGRALKTQKNDATWDDVLKNDILPTLRQSYYDLPIQLKQLFAYCSLFPKYYMFDKKELVLLWMAEGFLLQTKDKSMESLGRGYFEELKSRSFFRQLTKDESQYEMHELTTDLASSVAGEFFLMLDDKSENEPIENLRHLSFIRQTSEVYKNFEALQNSKRLRTFIAMSDRNSHSTSFPLSYTILEKLLRSLQFLRVLSLSKFSITRVPQFIGDLKHMRYLNFSHTSITCLPEEVGKLYNLQTLLVCDCANLSSLPNSLVKLQNLRHLGMDGTPELKKIPLGIGGLTHLQTLSKVFIEGDDGFNISELKDLSSLQGQLSIHRLDNVTTADQAKEANLEHKEGLDGLEMEWYVSNYSDKINEYEVLEVLQPHDRLKYLKIMLYGGEKFPDWVGDSSFYQLTELTLGGCRNCISLPTLGRLPLLQKLFVGSMGNVMSIGPEFLAPPNSSQDIDFPSLIVLEFKDMQSWMNWSIIGDGKSFPFLRELSIVQCPKLTDLPEIVLSALSRLTVHHCPELEKRCRGSDGNYLPIISRIVNCHIT